jgi:hypothetical protein
MAGLELRLVDFCHTPVLRNRNEASIRVPRKFNHTSGNNMINR